MVFKGINPDDIFEYVLEGEKDSEGVKTIWGLRSQGVASGNQSLARIVKAHGKRNIEESAEEQTKANRREFLKVVAFVKNFLFSGDSEPTPVVDDEKGILQVFKEIDISTFLELSNASKDIFTLRQGEKNGSNSSSGQPLPGRIPAVNVTTAGDAKSSEDAPGSLAS